MGNNYNGIYGGNYSGKRNIRSGKGINKMTTVEYHNCPKHGKERCFRDPQNPHHHFCQAFDFKKRIEVGSWDDKITLNQVLEMDSWNEVK